MSEAAQGYFLTRTTTTTSPPLPSRCRSAPAVRRGEFCCCFGNKNQQPSVSGQHLSHCCVFFLLSFSLSVVGPSVHSGRGCVLQNSHNPQPCPRQSFDGCKSCCSEGGRGRMAAVRDNAVRQRTAKKFRPVSETRRIKVYFSPLLRSLWSAPPLLLLLLASFDSTHTQNSQHTENVRTVFWSSFCCCCQVHCTHGTGKPVRN